jgi:DNA-binding NarL/FixJ family response regulator
LIIADDDPVVLASLSAALAGGFEVVGIATDGAAVVELARDTSPDVALVDLEMPAGGGLAAVKGIREVTPDAAVVLLSGDESDSVVRQLIRAGASAYCRKGISPQALAESLTDAISAHAEHRRRI